MSFTELLCRIDEDNDYLRRICYTDEAIFHTSGVVNGHNVPIWGSENPHVVFQNEQGSPKVNVWCVLMHNKVIRPFFLRSTPFQQMFTWTCWNFTLHLRRGG